MKPCSGWTLYVIVDRDAIGRHDLLDVAAAAIRGGADALQLRDKRASVPALLYEVKRLLRVTRPAGIPLIVNDHPDVAGQAGADGVHLGQDDLPLQAARALLGDGAIIGKSTHSLAQARAAQTEGADYIGFGPVFPTPTKPTYGSIGTAPVRDAAAHVSVPIVCIGGIDRTTLDQVLQAGARCVAVVRAVCGAADPEAATRALKSQLTQFARPTPKPTL